MAVSSYEFKWDIRKIRVMAIILLAVALTAAIGVFSPIVAGDKNLGVNVNLWWIGDLQDLINGFVSGIFPMIIGALISSDSIAWEFDKGTITSLLSQPVTRAEAYLGKFSEKVAVILMVSAVMTLVSVVTSTVSVGIQAYLIWTPIITLLLAMILLSVVAVSFFLGNIVKSPGMMLGAMLGLFLAFVIGVFLIAEKVGFQIYMAFVPFFNVALVMLSIRNFITNPSGTTVIPFSAFGNAHASTIATASLFGYVVAGLAIDIILFFFIGYVLFRRTEIKG